MKRRRTKLDKEAKGSTELRPATAAWVRKIIDGWALEDHQMKVLRAAAEAWDRREQARELLARDGLTYKNRFGDIKPHPAVAIERDSRLSFIRAVRELNLDMEPPESRPPALKFGGKRHA